MKMNPDKFHLLVSGKKHEVMIANVGKQKMIETHKVKLLGVTIDSELKFTDHMTQVCKKVSKKLNALSRQCAILPFQKRKMLMQTFILSQFNFCPLVWMCHNRGINNKINELHYRALRMVYNDNSSTFAKLLEKDGSYTIHQRNIQYLATEMYKILNNLAPFFLNSIFAKNKNLTTENVSANTRSKSLFYNYKAPKTRNYGLETLRCLGSKVYAMVPDEIKNPVNIKIFNEKIKK